MTAREYGVSALTVWTAFSPAFFTSWSWPNVLIGAPYIPSVVSTARAYVKR